MIPEGFDIAAALRERSELVGRLDREVEEKLGSIVKMIVECLREGGTIFACGNGGSATQAQHFAGELVGRFKMNRRSLPVFALTDNSAALTSIANDYAFADVFSRQIEGMAKSGDCLVALSTSGESENIVRACRTAREKGMRVFALTGRSGGGVASASEVTVKVPHTDTALVQELHLIIIHLICQLVESSVFSTQPSRLR